MFNVLFCFLRIFISILVLQVSLWSKESCLCCFVCLSAVSLLMCVSSAGGYGFVCIL